MQYLSVQEAVDRAFERHQAAKSGDKTAIPEAESLYNFALDNGPENSAVLYMAGSFYVETGKTGLGSVLLAASLEADDGFSPAWNNIGIAFRKMHRFARARQCFMRALECGSEPDSSTVSNIATTYNDEGDYANAVKWYDLAVEMDQENNEAKFNRAMALLSLQRWGEGWDAYDMGHLAGGAAQKKRGLRSYAGPGGADHPVWNGEKDKCVVVWGEQGVGDEVLFASCLPDLIACSRHVVFDCHKRLVNIFRNSFPGITCFPTREETDFKWAWPKELPEIEYRTAIGSLPRIFRRTSESFPMHSGYLKADERLIRHYKRPNFRVGIATVGGTHLTGIDKRSISHEFWGPTLSVPGVEFVSLDYKAGSRERMAAAAEMFNANITFDQEMIDDLDRQFACIAGLDLVITVTMSVCDFAGALGKECWTLVPKLSSWRFGTDGDGRLWYPSERLFRQTDGDKWGPVIEQVGEQLRRRVAL